MSANVNTYEHTKALYKNQLIYSIIKIHYD
jgi:hypothetical protein